MAKQSSQGTTLGYGATPTNIANISSIQGPNPSAEQIDVTALDSSGGYREFLQSFKDGGEVQFSMFMDGTDAGLQYLWTTFNAGTTVDWTITLADGSTLEFDGYISAPPGVNASVGDALTCDCSIKVTGATSPTWAS